MAPSTTSLGRDASGRSGRLLQAAGPPHRPRWCPTLAPTSAPSPASLEPLPTAPKAVPLRHSEADESATSPASESELAHCRGRWSPPVGLAALLVLPPTAERSSTSDDIAVSGALPKCVAWSVATTVPHSSGAIMSQTLPEPAGGGLRRSSPELLLTSHTLRGATGGDSAGGVASNGWRAPLLPGVEGEASPPTYAASGKT
mmetsp:Transcript_96983/g.279104  ORF Transcript_96983/g.279104 Transcript_96983/m.279104 type:complete len:201 (+) Transcript_96983:428-1030(+)